MAASGYVWLLLPNPLNFSAIRQSQLLLLFAIEREKVSVCHSIPRSHDKKQVFVLKCHFWTWIDTTASDIYGQLCPSAMQMIHPRCCIECIQTWAVTANPKSCFSRQGCGNTFSDDREIFISLQPEGQNVCQIVPSEKSKLKPFAKTKEGERKNKQTTFL